MNDGLNGPSVLARASRIKFNTSVVISPATKTNNNKIIHINRQYYFYFLFNKNHLYTTKDSHKIQIETNNNQLIRYDLNVVDSKALL